MSDDIKCDGCGFFKKYWVKVCMHCELIKAGEEIEKLTAQRDQLVWLVKEMGVGNVEFVECYEKKLKRILGEEDE